MDQLNPYSFRIFRLTVANSEGVQWGGGIGHVPPKNPYKMLRYSNRAVSQIQSPHITLKNPKQLLLKLYNDQY